MAKLRFKITGGRLYAAGNIVVNDEGRAGAEVKSGIAVSTGSTSGVFDLPSGDYFYRAEVSGNGEGKISLVRAKGGLVVDGPKDIQPGVAYTFGFFVPKSKGV